MTERKPIDWALLPMKRYAQFSGRAPRAEYWWFYLATVVVSWILTIVDKAIGASGATAGDMGILAALFSLATFIPTIAVTVRRLHDIGRTGWWLLAFVLLIALVFVPIGYMAMEPGNLENAPDPTGGMLALMIGAGIAALLMGITLFIFCVTRGDIGENRYGEDPYGPSNLEEVFA